jgi:cytochrome c-type protein NapC
MLLVILIVLAIAALVPLAVRPHLTARWMGRFFAFTMVVVAPVGIGFLGLEEHVERSKSVSFCLSCHVMEKYGRSLHIDDLDHVPAKHFQYGRVPRETACFACHTNYTMYGDLRAKLRGLRHVYVQYLGKVPEHIALYQPYNNRECLHCHDQARSFVDAVTHKSEPGRLDAIRANKLSCLTKGCHDVVHTVDAVDRVAMWPSDAKEKQR